MFTKHIRERVCLLSAVAEKSKWLPDSVKRINFNLRRIRDKLSAGASKKLNMPCIIHDTRGLARLMGMSKSPASYFSTHSRLPSLGLGKRERSVTVGRVYPGMKS